MRRLRSSAVSFADGKHRVVVGRIGTYAKGSQTPDLGLARQSIAARPGRETVPFTVDGMRFGVALDAQLGHGLGVMDGRAPRLTSQHVLPRMFLYHGHRVNLSPLRRPGKNSLRTRYYVSRVIVFRP